MTSTSRRDYTMKLATTCGDIDIALNGAKAPHTVNSFTFLAGKGFFDHTKCHRLTTDGIYVLQCGDPKGTGQGGPGYTIPDENLKDQGLQGRTCTRRARSRWPTYTRRREGPQHRRQPVLPRLPGQPAAARLHTVRHDLRPA